MEDKRVLQGDGKTDLAIGDADGKVTIIFPRPIEWLALDPSNAIPIATAIIDAAQKCGARVTVKTEAIKVPNALRERMEVRCMMILNNKREAAEGTPMLSKRIVDTLLNMLDL